MMATAWRDLLPHFDAAGLVDLLGDRGVAERERRGVQGVTAAESSWLVAKVRAFLTNDRARPRSGPEGRAANSFANA